MASRGRIIAYGLAGIPAAIGVAFVARYAYATSDTHDTGLASAALYGMTAAGAFAAPAAALAVANNGRKAAAWVLGALAVLAMLANWTNTLGAIATRGAGTEAATSKTKSDVADARKELRRLEGKIEGLGRFTPTTQAATDAAHAAVAAAERARKAECGDGNPKQRGKNCRAYEATEQTAREALASAETNKATTDTAAKLEADAAGVRARIAKAPPTPATNAIGEALERFLPMSAASAATMQQALVSAIVELLIAAALALPELLRPVRQLPAFNPPVEQEPAPVTAATHQHASEPATITGSVKQFMLACLQHDKTGRAPRGAIYKRYLRWCDEQEPKVAALPIPHFWAAFEPLCARVQIPLQTKDGKVYCIGVRLAA